MSKMSQSPERHTFQANRYAERCKAEGKEPSEDYLNLYKSAREQDKENMVNPGWQKNNLEYDLRSTKWILEKVRNSDVYAQNLYAALCNNEFQRAEMWEILTDQSWHCSWRHAGGIVADMQQKGDYIDWYCSGIRNDPTESEFMSMTDQEKEIANRFSDYVGECTVTDQIREDLRKLGWLVL